MDNKGRVSVPSEFRVDLKKRKKAPILTNLVECLALYPYEDWMEIEERLRRASPIHPEVQRMQRFLVSGAVECPIDSQGRIQVRTHLREHAALELEKEVTIAGVGPHIELWNKARFDRELGETRERFHEISSAVAQLGS